LALGTSRRRPTLIEGIWPALTAAYAGPLGGWIAELVTDGLGYIVIGALAGFWGSARLWNRWVREPARTP
jgi:hypothetical protein